MHGMKYTQVTSDVFKHIQLGAGVVLSTFDPTTAAVAEANIVGETSGGVSFKDTPEYTDFGEDIDNMPPNTKELKRVSSREVTMSGSFIAITPTLAARLIGGADVTSTKITPRMTLKDADFADVWWVGDYSDINNDTTGTGNSGAVAGFMAIHLINALNTNGFEISGNNDGKSTFPFSFEGHYSIESPDTVPYEVYVSAGTPAA